VNLYAVWPVDGGYDAFSHLQFKATNSSGTIILNSAYYVLNETSGLCSFAIKNGYLNTTYVYFSFRGNDSNYDAKADVFYDAR